MKTIKTYIRKCFPPVLTILGLVAGATLFAYMGSNHFPDLEPGADYPEIRIPHPYVVIIRPAFRVMEVNGESVKVKILSASAEHSVTWTKDYIYCNWNDDATIIGEWPSKKP